MQGAVAFLVRRTIEVGHARLQKETPPEVKIPTWGVLMLAITILFFSAVTSLIGYTFGRIIPTLIMIESPEAIPFEPLSVEDADEVVGGLKRDQERLLESQQPITASFRTTIKHLKSVGGVRACFRGLAVFVVYNFALHTISRLVSSIDVVLAIAAPTVASVLCAQLSLAWTHIVISDPSPKPWFRRLPTYKSWRKVALPTAIVTFIEEMAVFLPLFVVIWALGLSGLDQIEDVFNGGGLVVSLKALCVLALGLVLSFFVVLPANVVLVRIQASLLPDSEETIVPFDRSFGGKVVPEIVGGSGVIGILDAWNTFEWSARVRLVKAYLKLALMQLVLVALFSITVSGELFLIVGKDWGKLIPSDGNGDNPLIQ